MPFTREDVLAAAQQWFPNEDITTVKSVLDNYGIETDEQECERVQIAILKLIDVLQNGRRGRLRPTARTRLASKVYYRTWLSKLIRVADDLDCVLVVEERGSQEEPMTSSFIPWKTVEVPEIVYQPEVILCGVV